MAMQDKRMSRITKTMDTKRLHEPVIFEVPERGRMMSTHKIGAEIRAGSKGEKRVCAQSFHEGFIGEKRYLVPDSTLEAMADIIHLKVRHCEDTKNMDLFDPTDEQAGLSWWQKKRGSMMHKLDDLSWAGDNEDGNAKGDGKGEREDMREKENNVKAMESEDNSEEEDEDIADDEFKSEGRSESHESQEEEGEEEVEAGGDSDEVGKVKGEEREYESQGEEGEEDVEAGGDSDEVGEVEDEEREYESQEEEEEEEVEAEGDSDEMGEVEEDEREYESQKERAEEEVEEESDLDEKAGEYEVIEDKPEEDHEEESYVIQDAVEEASKRTEEGGEETIVDGERRDTLPTLLRGQDGTPEICKNSASGEEEKPEGGKDKKSVDEEDGESDIEDEQVSDTIEGDNETRKPVQSVREYPDTNKIERKNLNGKKEVERDYGPEVTRFLISGHIRSNRKPIYIVQKYHGPSLFRNKNPEFFSRRSEKDVEVLTCGEFFKESILEVDRYMQPASLKTGPRKVVIDSTSKVFEEKFTHVFVGTEVDLQISGSFIEHSQKSVYTPLISIVLRKGTGLKAHVPTGDCASVHLTRSTENKFEREVKRKIERQLRAVDGNHFLPTRRSASGDTALLNIAGRRHESLLEPETETDRWCNVRRSFSSEESPSDILEAFVRAECEKRRDRRRRERQRNSSASVLKQLLFWK